MSLIKKIKQFINGSWQEFQLDANNIDNVATREWVTNAEKTIIGDTSFNGDIILAGGGIKFTNEVYLDGSEIYYDGQYVGDFHPNAPYAYANKRWVESLVTNQVQYLGIVNSVDDIVNAFYSSDSALGKAGDFVRAGSSFTIETETVHPGDIIIANNVVPNVSLTNYDIVHTEDPGNYVTLATDQTITGKKTFENKIQIRSAAGEPERYTYLGLESLTFTSFNMDSFDSYITFWDNVRERKYNLKLPDLPDSVMPGNDLTEVIATQEWVKAYNPAPAVYSPKETTIGSNTFTFDKNIFKHGRVYRFIIINGFNEYMPDANHDILTNLTDSMDVYVDFTSYYTMGTKYVTADAIDYGSAGDSTRYIIPNCKITVNLNYDAMPSEESAKNVIPYTDPTFSIVSGDSKTPIYIDPRNVKLVEVR